jgi:hypothetical protein
MLNITYKLALVTMCGALLAAGSNASDASNIYNEPLKQAEQGATAPTQPAYWACPVQIMAVNGKGQLGYWTCAADIMDVTAKADSLVPLTDAPVSDKPDQPTWLLEDWSRYYDYSRLIPGD